MLKVYNQLTKQVEEIKPQREGEISIYTCGPTVYNFAHIGNFASYIYWDLMVRTLTVEGFDVKRILNLTDVGHLTSDGDEGEDKLEKGARRENKTVWEVAETYINAYMKDFRSLNLAEPYKICRATDYIEADIELVNKMEENGYLYETSDGMYFDTSKFPDYAKFAQLDLDQMRAGARVEFSSEKRNVSDFAVWKFIKEGEDHAMQWEYKGRMGYPGWHLECSTIIEKELGSPIDIHTGGIDHIPVHHTNEIAQTMAVTGGKLANYWMHCSFINIDNQKISKSLGNTYTLEDLKEKGFSPLDFKMWILQGHYRGDRNFTFDDLKAAQTRRASWRNRAARAYQQDNHLDDLCEEEYSKNEGLKSDLLEALDNNLNSAEAFKVIDEVEPDYRGWQFIDKLFGLDLLVSEEPSEELLSKIAKREEARKNKDWAVADQMRDEIAAEGYTVLDTADGPVWQYK